MKLTKEQIQQLYKFTRQHYVEHFDVQAELVDHLANDIEQIWQKQPNLSFEQARDISFKKFGIFGFMDVVEARQKSMNKKYWKVIVHFVKEWFQIQKIILTTLLFLSFYVVCKTMYAHYILLSVLIVVCIYSFYKGFHLQRIFKRNFKNKGKKWMLEEMIFKTGVGTFIFLPVHFYNFFNLSKFENNGINLEWVTLLYSAVFTMFIILIYIILEVLPQKAEELLTENYPEYKLV